MKIHKTVHYFWIKNVFQMYEMSFFKHPTKKEE